MSRCSTLYPVVVAAVLWTLKFDLGGHPVGEVGVEHQLLLFYSANTLRILGKVPPASFLTW